jgi:uncharacterized protein (UPF0276 family)
MTVHIGVSLMLEDEYRAAVLPAFEAGIVDAIEWSFDQAWGRRTTPAWIEALLDHYAAAGRLWGHGVSGSPGSAEATMHHDAWRECLRAEVGRRVLRGVSEHVGFIAAGGLDAGAPLPMIDGDGARAVLSRNLAAIAAIARCPVGLENLALAFDRASVWEQGPMLRDVLAATDGYLVLDLHNLWCQIANFGVDARALLESYPLSRVRCIHVSGGSWWTAIDGTSVRRDTHDDAVPDEVLALLDDALPRCDALEVVILERLGGTLAREEDRALLCRELESLHARVHGARHG